MYAERCHGLVVRDARLWSRKTPEGQVTVEGQVTLTLSPPPPTPPAPIGNLYLLTC